MGGGCRAQRLRNGPGELDESGVRRPPRSFLQANSGEVRRYNAARAGWAHQIGREGVEVGLIPGEGTSVAVSTSTKVPRREELVATPAMRMRPSSRAAGRRASPEGGGIRGAPSTAVSTV